MDTFTYFFFSGPGWYWHYLLLALLCYLISPKINNTTNNGNTYVGTEGEATEDGSQTQEETKAS